MGCQLGQEDTMARTIKIPPRKINTSRESVIRFHDDQRGKLLRLVEWTRKQKKHK